LCSSPHEDRKGLAAILVPKSEKDNKKQTLASIAFLSNKWQVPTTRRLLREATSSAIVARTSFPASCLAYKPVLIRFSMTNISARERAKNRREKRSLTSLMTRQNPTFAG